MRMARHDEDRHTVSEAAAAPASCEGKAAPVGAPAWSEASEAAAAVGGPASSADEAFARMSELGARGEPFLFVLDYHLREPYVLTAEEIPPGVRFAFPHGVRTIGGEGEPAPGSSFAAGAPPYISRVEPVSFERYRRGFEIVQEAQRQGESYLANLTYPSEIGLSGTLDTVFEQARAAYRLKFDERFVVFSPEPFVRISGSSIRTFPMKGTREVRSDEACARRALYADEKEAAEHATVVDLLRNDLGRVSTSVRVPRYRYIERLDFPDKVLLAASSEITGMLEPDWPARLGEIFRNLLPAGSITGAPKDRTCRILEQAEGYDRGFYTGVFGWFDGEGVQSAVMIRFIESHNGGFRFKSGGGITIYSDCEREYRELVQKVAIPLDRRGHAGPLDRYKENNADMTGPTRRESG
ncbi:MAG: aminodeoxychorismate synthase component I [bacterium]